MFKTQREPSQFYAIDVAILFFLTTITSESRIFHTLSKKWDIFYEWDQWRRKE